MCWYDYRAIRTTTPAAPPLRRHPLPAGQDPWTLDDRAWAQITTWPLGSACTDITATVETLPRNGTDETTVTLTATQVLSVDGTPYQTAPITLTRILQRDPGGCWLIGPAVTAN